jgi:hypothetical protein
VSKALAWVLVGALLGAGIVVGFFFPEDDPQPVTLELQNVDSADIISQARIGFVPRDSVQIKTLVRTRLRNVDSAAIIAFARSGYVPENESETTPFFYADTNATVAKADTAGKWSVELDMAMRSEFYPEYMSIRQRFVLKKLSVEIYPQKSRTVRAWNYGAGFSVGADLLRGGVVPSFHGLIGRGNNNIMLSLHVPNAVSLGYIHNF